MVEQRLLNLIRNFFANRLSIELNPEWLNELVEFIARIQRRDEEILKVGYHQWLHANLVESSKPNFPGFDSNTKVFNERAVFQIESVLDIGDSMMSQFRKLTYKAADNAEFQTDNDENMDTKTPFWEQKPKQMLFFQLSDGQNRAKALEYRPLSAPDFSPLIKPGCKYRRNIFLLTPRNCQLLGGDVDELMATNLPVQLMSKKLNKPLPDQEKRKIETILASRTQPEERPLSASNQLPTLPAHRHVPITSSSSSLSNSSLVPPLVKPTHTTSERSSAPEPMIVDPRSVRFVDPPKPESSIRNVGMTSSSTSHSNQGPSIAKKLDKSLDSLPEDEKPQIPKNEQPRQQTKITGIMIKQKVFGNVRHDTSSSLETPTPSKTSTNQDQTTPPIATIRPLRSMPHEPGISTSTLNEPPEDSISPHIKQEVCSPDQNTPNRLGQRHSSSTYPIFKERREMSALNPFAKRHSNGTPKGEIPVITIAEDGPGIKEEPKTPPKKKRAIEECDEKPGTDVYVAKFKALNIMLIADAVKLMKFSVGRKRVLLQAMMLRETERLLMVDDEWTMKIELIDGSQKPLVCRLSHDLLCSLMGMTPSQAIAIKTSKNNERIKDGQSRIQALNTQLGRLDLLFEVELFAANASVPMVHKVETFLQRIF